MIINLSIRLFYSHAESVFSIASFKMFLNEILLSELQPTTKFGILKRFFQDSDSKLSENFQGLTFIKNLQDRYNNSKQQVNFRQIRLLC